MRYSLLFGKTRKEVSKDEISLNAQLLIRGGFVDKLAAGIYTYLPLGLRVLKKIENIIREEMNGLGAQEILMPALQPKDIWEQTGRWESLDVLYKLKSRQDKEYALGSTQEEVVTPLVKKFISSYKDLPLYLYQIQTKFRDEPRAKSGILRGREFGMKDLYSFHTTQEDLENFYQKAIDVYLRLFTKCGLKAYKIEASGGTFTKKFSHEFAVITPAGEDEMIYCDACGFAQNTEVAKVSEKDPCPTCGKELKKATDVEAGNIFDLQTKYTDAFDFKYQDKDGQLKPVLMGCYGIGTSRLLGTIVEASHDDKGIIWPASVAPYLVHLVALGSDPEIAKQAEKVYQDMQQAGIEVLYDDRDEQTGVKLNDADLIGIPCRVIISKKTLSEKSAELKARAEEKAELVKLDKLVNQLKICSQ